MMSSGDFIKCAALLLLAALLVWTSSSQGDARHAALSPNGTVQQSPAPDKNH
jgi:hypothetical protein